MNGITKRIIIRFERINCCFDDSNIYVRMLQLILDLNFVKEKEVLFKRVLFECKPTFFPVFIFPWSFVFDARNPEIPKILLILCKTLVQIFTVHILICLKWSRYSTRGWYVLQHSNLNETSELQITFENTAAPNKIYIRLNCTKGKAEITLFPLQVWLIVIIFELMEWNYYYCYYY